MNIIGKSIHDLIDNNRSVSKKLRKCNRSITSDPPSDISIHSSDCESININTVRRKIFNPMPTAHLPTANETNIHQAYNTPPRLLHQQRPTGRPSGSTVVKKKEETLKEKEAKYRIVCRYLLEVQNNIYPHNIPKKDIYKKVFEQEVHRHHLPSTFKFPYNTVLSRISRSSLNAEGSHCPLIFIEDQIVDILLCMSKIKRALSVAEGLRLINELIRKTEIQQRLIDWKIAHRIYTKKPEDMGRVGTAYWFNLMKRKKHLLRTKKGRKYGLDRANFTTYLNFRDMYDHIENILVDECGVATRFSKPVWMNSSGEIVSNFEDAMGCKVSIDIDRKDMCIVLDEVGCNLTQEKDGSKGGEKYVCAPHEVPYQASSTKNNHFTCLGLTRLDGEPLMCVVLIQGKRRDILTETGVDWNKLCHDGVLRDINNDDEIAFFTDNLGKDKLFPGGPSCFYKGKEVPSFVTFTDGGGMDGFVLTGIFRRLDALKLYNADRKNGLIPFVLLDGHSSRFELEFLQYINDDSHRWNVCIGVPYGTALWQVADSSQQNGMFKMSLTEKKKDLFDNRMNTFQQKLHLLRTDIIPLVNYAFKGAFCNVGSNLKAISERGWSPYNRMLLLDPLIRANMTEDMMDWERRSGFFSRKQLKTLHNVEMCVSNGTISIRNITHSNLRNTNLNFNGGPTAQYVSNTIMSSVDRQNARERNQKLKEEGTTAQERLDQISRKITAAKMTLDVRQYNLDHNIRDHCKRIVDNRNDEERRKRHRSELQYLKLCYKADEAIAKHSNNNNVNTWTTKSDITTYLRPLKRQGDSKMPTEKGELIKRYAMWKGRSRKDVTMDETVLESFNKWKEEEDAKKNRGKKNK